MNPDQNNPLNGQPVVGVPPTQPVNPVNPQMPPQAPLPQTPPPPPQAPVQPAPVQMAPPQAGVPNPQMAQPGYQVPPQGQPVMPQQPGYNQPANPNAYYGGQATGKSTLLSRLKLNKKVLMTAFGLFLVGIASFFAFNFLSGNNLKAEKEFAVSYVEAVQEGDYETALGMWPEDSKETMERYATVAAKLLQKDKNAALEDVFSAEKKFLGDSKDIIAEKIKVVNGSEHKCAVVLLRVGTKEMLMVERYEGEEVAMLGVYDGDKFDKVDPDYCDKANQDYDDALKALKNIIDLAESYTSGDATQTSQTPDLDVKGLFNN